MAHVGIPNPPPDITVGVAIAQNGAKVMGSISSMTVFLSKELGHGVGAIRVVQIQSDDAKPIKVVLGASVPINVIDALLTDSAGSLYTLSVTVGFASAILVTAAVLDNTRTVTVTFLPAATNPQVTVTEYSAS